MFDHLLKLLNTLLVRLEDFCCFRSIQRLTFVIGFRHQTLQCVDLSWQVDSVQQCTVTLFISTEVIIIDPVLN